jgi:hypothetical protein
LLVLCPLGLCPLVLCPLVWLVASQHPLVSLVLRYLTFLYLCGFINSLK